MRHSTGKKNWGTTVKPEHGCIMDDNTESMLNFILPLGR